MEVVLCLVKGSSLVKALGLGSTMTLPSSSFPREAWLCRGAPGSSEGQSGHPLSFA